MRMGLKERLESRLAGSLTRLQQQQTEKPENHKVRPPLKCLKLSQVRRKRKQKKVFSLFLEKGKSLNRFFFTLARLILILVLYEVARKVSWLLFCTLWKEKETHFPPP